MTGPNSLESLREEIDRIDDALHDLVQKRVRLVEKVRDVKGAASVDLLRPGREAEILRRLLARHRGPFPKLALVRIWREMLGAMVGLQGEFSVAVYMPERGAGYLALARDHYGSATPMTSFRSPGQVVRAVAEGSASVGLLPMPDRDDGEPWWVNLMGDGPDMPPRIIGRLPFAGSGPDGLEALAVARLKIDPTGYDRAWLAVETTPDVSRARLRSVLGAAGLEVTQLAATLRNDHSWLHLLEISGALAADDRRLIRLGESRDPVSRAVVLGGYPVPFAPEDLAD